MTTKQFRDVHIYEATLKSEATDEVQILQHLVFARLADAMQYLHDYLYCDDTPVEAILYDRLRGAAFLCHNGDLVTLSIKTTKYIPPCPSSTSVAEIASSLE